MESYHVPVMPHEVLSFLLNRRDGVYIDGTLGGGGHAEFFLQHLSEDAIYIGVDRDQEAIDFSRQRLAAFHNVFLYKGLYSEIGSALQQAGVSRAHGIFFDLGISSHQLDKVSRGFAFRSGVALDMRMDESDKLTAADILSTYEEKRLMQIFFDYGEERYSRQIARRIVQQREQKAITSSDELMKIIDRCVPGKHITKSYARIFQAIRIEVNQELTILQQALEQAMRYLEVSGRIGVISYHSLEDRIVKNFFKQQENPCTCPKGAPYCVCGKTAQLKRIKPFLITPAEEEIHQNPRARSAKLRVGEKL